MSILVGLMSLMTTGIAGRAMLMIAVQVLEGLTTGALVSVCFGNRGFKMAKHISRMKAQLPLYTLGGWVTIERDRFSRPEWSRSQGEGSGWRA